MTSRPFLDRFSLRRKICVITGGAGLLGSELAAAFLGSGAVVVVADIKKKSAKELTRLYPEAIGQIYSFSVDVTKPSSVHTLVRSVEKKVGPIDVWINNAGVGVFTPFASRTMKEFDRVMNINLKGTFNGIQAVSIGMAKRRRGVIINIGSIYGVVSPDPRIYGGSKRNSSEVYGASKAAVIQMTKYFAAHLAPSQIRVNCVSPGGIFNSQSPGFVRNYVRKTPLGRMALAGDIAGGVVYLASDASAYVTGQNLLIDGGWTLW